MNIAKQKNILLQEIKIQHPHHVNKYKEIVLDMFYNFLEDSDDEDKDHFEGIIYNIENSKNIDDINNIIYKDFFFNDDIEGFEEFKREVEEKINNRDV